MSNYFQNKTDSVRELMHFPYSTFTAFQQAVVSGEVVDMGIAMDHARSWAMQAEDAPRGQMILKYLLMTSFLLMPIFYIIAAFFMNNYWLIPYALVPVLVFFTGSPIARKVFPLHWILLAGLGILWLVSGNFPHPIYWLPILIEYKGFDYLYRGSAQLVREQIPKSEKTLILFWKHWDLTLYLKNGEKHSQRGIEKDGKYSFNQDVQDEWEAYLATRKK